MKWYMVNETGSAKIQNWIDTYAKAPQNLQAWVLDAEEQMSYNDNCILEFRTFETVTGRPETKVLTKDDFYAP